MKAADPKSHCHFLQARKTKARGGTLAGLIERDGNKGGRGKKVAENTFHGVGMGGVR